MTNVDDKLKVFTNIIMEKVQGDCEIKMEEFAKIQSELLDNAKKEMVKQSEDVIRQMRKRAEIRKNAIISKAIMDKQYAVLKKRKEIFDETVEGIARLAEEFVAGEEYKPFLEKCIRNGLMQIDAKNIQACFTSMDLETLGSEIKSFIDRNKREDVDVVIKEADRSIIGGCIFQDDNGVMRVDCSMRSMIDENRSLIGKVIVDNL